ITTDKRIRDIVNKSTAPQGQNELEIAGYRNALDLIHSSYSDIPFSEKSILELHLMLLQPSGDDLAGKYKTEDNFIMETDRLGVRSVRFTPIPASETSASMEQLILAYHDAYSESEINPLLLIPCVILDFLCIHPFRDGNGRMSRLLSLLLLYKCGFRAGKYVSIEERINTYKNYYYTSLQKSSERWHENDNNYFPFIDNFLFNLKMSYFELDSRFANFKDKKITKKQRIGEFITGSLLPVSKRDICDKLPDISVTSVEVELGRLLKSGEIEKIGNGRGTKYRPVIKTE
ncbi:MAG: Fic family protein, partial [Oscillospiraceae bacterium]|nr:Fic family protein [Oscillospiraceae bacterium]